MADDEHEHDANGDSDETNQENEDALQKKGARFDNFAAADLEKVTDYAEEKEVIPTDEFKGAEIIIGYRRSIEAADKLAKERELLKISIKKEDVDLIVKEMEISRIVAERTLREHCGNVVNALVALTN
uniref:Nascent polypeptide-associated complex subunit alpha-like UBA domain-containing protein n=1 Tax=Clastoptera arizonana TaxID=38151 RepID=A0A1B6CZU9_9HEMI